MSENSQTRTRDGGASQPTERILLTLEKHVRVEKHANPRIALTARMLPESLCPPVTPTLDSRHTSTGSQDSSRAKDKDKRTRVPPNRSSHRMEGGGGGGRNHALGAFKWVLVHKWLMTSRQQMLNHQSWCLSPREPQLDHTHCNKYQPPPHPHPPDAYLYFVEEQFFGPRAGAVGLARCSLLINKSQLRQSQSTQSLTLWNGIDSVTNQLTWKRN